MDAMTKKPVSEVCTTQEAAEILGMSVSTVQQLVESGQLPAWKTRGGHRRIPLNAVHDFRAARGSGMPMPKLPAEPRTTILVLEDDPMQRAVYEAQIKSWNLPAKVTYCENGYQALLEIAMQQPDIVLVDIMMAGIDGYEVVNAIYNRPHLRHINIAIISGISEEELAARGGVPPGVVFFPKPVCYDELRGYVRACCAQTARAAA